MRAWEDLWSGKYSVCQGILSDHQIRSYLVDCTLAKLRFREVLSIYSTLTVKVMNTGYNEHISGMTGTPNPKAKW